MIITSTKNARIVAVRKLSQRKHRQRQNRFLVEGLQLLGMAVEALAEPLPQARVKPLELFYSEELFTGPVAPRLKAALIAAGATPVHVAAHVLDTISARDTSQGLAATFALDALEWPPERLGDLPPPAAGPGLILILDRLQDPGNLGTLIRTTDAVGGQAVLLLEPCVDPFDPKTVRGTMGSLFNLPLLRTASLAALLPMLREQGYQLIGADAARGDLPWQTEALVGPVALVLGNEARGLTPALHAHLDGYVHLPLRGRAESLNVSVAGGALMYEWLRLNAG